MGSRLQILQGERAILGVFLAHLRALAVSAAVFAAKGIIQYAG